MYSTQHIQRVMYTGAASGDGAEKLLQGMNDSKEFKDRIAVLTIAYHNLAVEQEFMHMVSPEYCLDQCQTFIARSSDHTNLSLLRLIVP